MSDILTCLTCGLSWDDSISTGWTPVPAARCPFEYFHKEQGGELKPQDIPEDFPVKPVSPVN